MQGHHVEQGHQVDSNTCVEDLKSYIANFEIDIRKLECISNSNARYKSFKLTVARSQFNELLKDNICPEAVYVRMLILEE